MEACDRPCLPARCISISPIAFKQRQHCLGYDVDVQTGRPLANVKLIEQHAIVIAEVGPTRHLPQARDSRLHTGMKPEYLAIETRFAFNDRPWTDDAHVAAQNVPDLRQLVQAELAEQGTKSGYARVLAELAVPRPLL